MEVVVAAFLLAIIIFSVMAALTYTSRITRRNGYAVAAKNIAQSYLERMQVDDFNAVNAENYPNIEYDSNPPVYLDRALGITCRIHFEFKGFGTLENSSADNLTDANAHWAQDEWNGETVFLTSGEGAGQFGRIDFNTPNTLHLVDSLDVNPRKGTQYLINNGKAVDITVTYRFRGQEHSQKIRSLVINK